MPTMKIMTSSEAEQNFNQLIASAEKEPVTITKNNKEVDVVISYKSYQELKKLEDILFMKNLTPLEKDKINTGIKEGLNDSKAGKGHEVSDEFIWELQGELIGRLDSRK